MDEKFGGVFWDFSPKKPKKIEKLNRWGGYWPKKRPGYAPGLYCFKIILKVCKCLCHVLHDFFLTYFSFTQHTKANSLIYFKHIKIHEIIFFFLFSYCSFFWMKWKHKQKQKWSKKGEGEQITLCLTHIHTTWLNAELSFCLLNILAMLIKLYSKQTTIIWSNRSDVEFRPLELF